MTLNRMRQQGRLYMGIGMTFSGKAEPNINIIRVIYRFTLQMPHRVPAIAPTILLLRGKQTQVPHFCHNSAAPGPSSRA